MDKRDRSGREGQSRRDGQGVDGVNRMDVMDSVGSEQNGRRDKVDDSPAPTGFDA